MGKRKQKIVYDKEKSEQKSAIRIPMGRAVEVHEDKKRYSRKKKHKKEDEDQE